MTQPSIPLVDLGIQHRRIADEIRIGFDRVFDKTSFVLGPEVERFEQMYAEYCGTEHCIGVANGTDAIELALRGCGVGAGDEVIIPANTFVATAEAVARTGATVVLADCDEMSLIEPADVATKVTQRTKAIVPVHLYGQMAPMKALYELAGDGVYIVEDAAQSQGAVQGGRRSGSIGHVSATSFYPGKNLGAYGDAGAITTNDHVIAGRIRALRNHGGTNKYEHLEVGVNSRMDGLQAVVLNAKLHRLDDWNGERLAAAARYDGLLSGVEPVARPAAAPLNDHVWHLYVVRVAQRDEILKSLNAKGIGAGVHYPVPVHLLPAFAHLELKRGAFPVAERLAGQILSLPIYPGITAEQQVFVVDALISAVTRQ